MKQEKKESNKMMRNELKNKLRKNSMRLKLRLQEKKECSKFMIKSTKRSKIKKQKRID